MMSTHTIAIPPIPKETERSARAIFGRRNFYILTGEYLESILEDIKPVFLLEAGIILPQISFFQFLEGLTDVQAVEAVRTRLDWKFALHLPVYPPTIRERTLCEFRQRALNDLQYQREFQMLVDRFVTFNPPHNDRFQSFISLELLSFVCWINRLNWLRVTMGRMLEVLAISFPEWLRKNTLPHWYGRYSHITTGFEVNDSSDQQEYSMEEIAVDIDYLLNKIHQSTLPEISELKEVRALEGVWRQNAKTLFADKHEVLKSTDCASCIYRTEWMEV
jgi:transposase